LANIREPMHLQVIRVFNDDDVVHVEGKGQSQDDIETITPSYPGGPADPGKGSPRMEKDGPVNKDPRRSDKRLLPESARGRDTLYAAARCGWTSRRSRELSLLTTKPSSTSSTSTRTS